MRKFEIFRYAAALVIFTSAFCMPAAAAEMPYNAAAVGGTLSGTLTMPDGLNKPPVVLILAGSGPTDRDGNAPPGMTSDAYKLLAADLARRGIASVRFDKRGVAASAAVGGRSALRFADYVDDAIAYVRRLRNDGRFSKVAIAGHSEGAIIATVAAERVPLDALILLEGPGRPLGVVLREQLAAQLSPFPDLAAKNETILSALESGKTVADVPAALSTLYRPSIQSFLISEISIDPAKELAKVTCPVTIVQGTFDAQVSLVDANRLKAASPSADLVIVPAMSHMLKRAPSAALSAQLHTVYADPSLPVDPAVGAAIAHATIAPRPLP